MSFQSHKLNETGFKELTNLKTEIVHLKKVYEKLGKNDKNVQIALEKLEESSFWATKALSSKKENHSEVIKYG